MNDNTNLPEEKAPPYSGENITADAENRLENRLSVISVTALGVFFVAVALFLIFFPRSTVSDIEKRELAAFPKFSFGSYFSGEYTSGIATFYDDTVPYRDSFKNMGNRIKSVFGFPKSENTVIFINNPNKVTEVSSNTAEVSSSAPVQALPEGEAGRDNAVSAASDEPDQKDYTAEEADGVMTENGMIVINQGGHFRALELFGGGSGNSYASALNSLRSQVGENVRIYSMPAPLPSEFYIPSNYSDYNANQSECFDKVAAKLDAGITSINICKALAKHTEEPIYCRTDHHWQPLGAYYAAREFAAAAGVPFADLTGYTKKVNSGFVGTMYAFTGSADLLNDPEDFTYYMPNAPYTATYYDAGFNYLWDGDDLFDTNVGGSNSYLTYLGGDEYVVKADTAVKNGRRLLVIKDSYGNAEIPYYVNSFEQVFVVDMRYFRRNLVSFINDMSITDVLFSMCSYSVVGGNAEHLDALLTQNSGETVTDPHPVDFTPTLSDSVAEAGRTKQESSGSSVNAE